MTSTDNYVLVEKARIAEAGVAPGAGQPVEFIKTVIRTYETNGRAQEDLDLINEMLPERRFEVLTVGFVDR
jgi:hypothetical protein